MKHIGLILICFLAAACSKSDKSDSSYFITPETTWIEIDASKSQKNLIVSSNCNWTVSASATWIEVRKFGKGSDAFLQLNIAANETDFTRDGSVTLAYGEKASSTIQVSQKGHGTESELSWTNFALNSLGESEFDLLPDGVGRRYRISSIDMFVTSAFHEKIYVGHLINHQTDLLTLQTYDQFTYNPIVMMPSSWIETPPVTAVPSYNTLNTLAQAAIASEPTQNLGTVFQHYVTYGSYRQLHLLGMGNLGVALDELFSGKPYAQEEMKKPTGLIYDYAQKVFSIAMDYQTDLIQEDPGALASKMSYINQVIYGRTAFLFVESSYEESRVDAVVNKIMSSQGLLPAEQKVADELTTGYLYFDKTGTAQFKKGNKSLINDYHKSIKTLDIVPLTFTINRYDDNSVDKMVLQFDLP